MDDLGKIDFGYGDKNIRFSLRDLTKDKKFNFSHSDTKNNQQFKKLKSKLKLLEGLTWRKWVGMTREQGLTVEKASSKSFQDIDNCNTNDLLKNLNDKHYFHFRVDGGSVFRVFGYQDEDLFCITHIDFKGKKHH